jgi:3-dehydroquinate synthase
MRHLGKALDILARIIYKVVPIKGGVLIYLKPDNSQSLNLILIGFMGTGKTTVGRLCAERLGYSFCDSDALIEQRTGHSIPELFAEEGEAAFRRIERDVIEELTAQSPCVIATGGGAVLDPDNVARLRASGVVVHLHADPEALLERVGDTRSRPLLATGSDARARIAALLAERRGHYARAAHAQVDTSAQTAEAAASAVLERYRSHVQESPRSPRCVPVALGDRSYDIHIEAGLLHSGRAAEIVASLASGRRACMVTHPHLNARYAAPLREGLEAHGIATTTVTVPPGERAKNLRTVARLYHAFLAAGLDRKSLVLAVGGGVLGDLVGFAAATYLRGVRLVQVPTTLLAQVDASVGGKTGVDLPEGKNLVGAFHQPRAVLIDPATLKTLPRRELHAGLAEVLKYGIIYDETFFHDIVSDLPALLRRSETALTAVIARSCEIKAEVVGQDETEQGLRAILNYGHTVGHALEAVTAYRRYKHGEAVAIGMISAALIGEEIGVTPPEVTRALRKALTAAHLPVAFPNDIDVEAILAAAQRDKKTEAGRLRFVLARRIGAVSVSGDVPTEAIRAAITRQQNGTYA